MSILLFLIVLAILIFVHELGHFLVAKFSGIRVDEFAIGFPPRLFSWRRGETSYSLNLIPFGGYVKIFGEDPDEESTTGPDSSRSFVNKPKYTQAIVLVAGVTFNVLLAWLLFSGSLMSGLQAPVGYLAGADVKDPHVVIGAISPNSPAQEAGLMAGDRIESISVDGKTLESPNLKVTDIQNLTAESKGLPIDVGYKRGEGQIQHVTATAKEGIVPGKLGLGISMETVGTLKENPFKALVDGAKITGVILSATAVGLFDFLKNLITGHADFSQVTGPVGIVGYVGQAYSLGFLYLIDFVSFISINLAIINLLPFPALDGGRLLFIVIEAIKGSPIRPKVANALNSIGFALLILLMLVVTYHDVAKLFIK